MTTLAFDDPCVVFALGRESREFRRLFATQQPFPGAPCRAHFRGPSWLTVLTLETGVGKEKTNAALDWLLAGPTLDKVPYRPKLVVSAGYCGALEEGWQVGDVLLATDIVDEVGKVVATTWPGPLPAGPWNPPLGPGRLLTASRLVGEPAEKRRLGQAHHAQAVDMEAIHLAGRCQKAGIPFGCVRAVSDSVETELSPRLVELLGQGRVSPWKCGAALLRQPSLAAEFWRLARGTALASKQLGTALGELLTLTLDWMG